jgi:cytochrome c biogenesis protein
MTKLKNPVWRFFVSVKLALITLIILAITSIFGTLIQQGKAPAYYAHSYGPTLARLFETLGLTNMYSSWWYVGLLCLFAVNLLVCSIDRLPGTWRMVVRDNLATDPEQLERMSSKHISATALLPGSAADKLFQLLVDAGWRKPRRRDWEESALLFSHKGAWTRLGVYVVHLSILVILAGALVGIFFGFQAYVFLPEGRTTSQVFLKGSKKPFPLGFELRGDKYSKSYYPNGMVREYRADLTAFDPKGGASFHKSIVVNDPLTYRGITFYLADSLPMDEYFVVVREQSTGREQAFRLPPNRDAAWPGTGISFRIEELKRDRNGVVKQAKVRFTSDGGGQSSVFWIKDKGTVALAGPGKGFTFSFRQIYSTLLLTKKDPGVPILFIGCILMVIGLGISLFLSHQRIWVLVTPRGKQGTRILVSGAGNKNKAAFERRFHELITRIEGDSSISIPRKGSRSNTSV